MLTGDPIQDDVQWLLQELKQVDQDIEIVRKYYEFFERGNTVSTRYQAIDEEVDMLNYLVGQMKILQDAREDILYELECLDETYLEGPRA
jgi:ketosteroid isomerase-like protein